MRDHPAHSIEILGSGWGARLGQLERKVIDEAFGVAVKDMLFWAPRNTYGPDQGFLKRYANIIIHVKDQVTVVGLTFHAALRVVKLTMNHLRKK